jgi:alkanesulfonate monooxygenase SsuD/methylene tetrahydromethanopterin reductase-like flavin-dependent oxidoreductase (luciferase family)
VRIGIKPGQWGWSFADLERAWREAEEAGFAIISSFDHVTAAPAGAAAWDAPSLLCAMAGKTERAAVAVDVINSSLRNPFFLAGQLAVAQAASGGRLEVGLGAGSYHLARFDHAALGIEFPKREGRLRRLEECCRILPALWRGESVTDEELGLRDAALGPLGIRPPPIFVGGTSEGILALAARHGEGWNAVEHDPEAYAALARRVDELAGRPLRKAVQIFLRDVELETLRDRLRALEDAGAESATIVLTEEGPDGVARVAEAVL